MPDLQMRMSLKGEFWRFLDTSGYKFVDTHTHTHKVSDWGAVAQ